MKTDAPSNRVGIDVPPDVVVRAACMRFCVPVVTLLLLASACSSGSPTAEPSNEATSIAPVPSPTLAQLEALAERCGSPTAPSAVMWFRSSDGTQLDGAELGSGPVGVVLGHQFPAGLWGWGPVGAHPV